MKIESKKLNIPDVSVWEAVDALTSLYVGAMDKGIPFAELPTPFLWGPPGVGKSEGIMECADMIEERTGKKVFVRIVHLSYYTPQDINGLPVPNAKRDRTVYLRPEILDFDPSGGMINILFLDELSAAPLSTQIAAYQLCLNRAAGEHKLPDNTIVIAAGNRTTDRSIAYSMPKALANRLMHFNVSFSFPSWKDWALRNGIDRRIIGYLSFDQSRANTEPDAGDLAFTTPRSWTLASNSLKAVPDDCPYTGMYVSGCVGTDAALEFGEWCKVYSSLPSVSDIMHGRCSDYPTRQDVLFALSSSLEAALYTDRERVAPVTLENVCAYVSRFPPDFAFTFFKDLNNIPELKTKMMACHSVQRWLSVNKKYL